MTSFIRSLDFRPQLATMESIVPQTLKCGGAPVSTALVSMPFGPLFSPSIGLSLLKAALTREGMASRIHYFTVRFAELTGSRFYLGIANGVRPSVRSPTGERIFSAALFAADDDDRYVDTILHRPVAQNTIRHRGSSPALYKRNHLHRQVR